MMLITIFCQVAIDKDFVDMSGNCGNLSSAVGPFAIKEGLVDNVPENGVCCVRIWQSKYQKTILCYVTMVDGMVKKWEIITSMVLHFQLKKSY